MSAWVAEDMQLALKNQSEGVMVVNDYRPALVLSGYGPIPALGVGVAVQIDLVEVQMNLARDLAASLDSVNGKINRTEEVWYPPACPCLCSNVYTCACASARPRYCPLLNPNPGPVPAPPPAVPACPPPLFPVHEQGQGRLLSLPYPCSCCPSACSALCLPLPLCPCHCPTVTLSLAVAPRCPFPLPCFGPLPLLLPVPLPVLCRWASP